MNSKSNIIYLVIILLLISNCSLDTKTGLWENSEKIKLENEKIEIIFKDAEILEKEFNPNIKINLKNNYKKNSFVANLTNNNGIVDFNGNLKRVSKYKFSKISQFDSYQPELLITNKKSLIFFDDKGSILNFDNNKKLIWKTNVYSKVEKKSKPKLYFSSNDNILIVTDSLANYYALDIINGNLIWLKKNSAPFNSQIKILNDKFFVVDFENILRCFSMKDGSEVWNYKTEKSFIKSQQKLSLIIKNDKLVFINTLGDLSSIDINTGNLVWQTPTQSSSIYENYFSLKNSDIIYENEMIYFSNNKNNFFGIDFNNGTIRWKQSINSNLRPTFVDGLILTITLEGYLVAIDARNGNILRITSIFDKIKNYKKKGIKPVGFVVVKDKIFLSLNNGRLLIIDTLTGKPIDIIKIDNKKISRPYFLDNDMFVIVDNAILKLN